MTSMCGLNLLTQDVACVCENGCVSVCERLNLVSRYGEV